MKKKILILSANPKGTGRLRLDEEVREIEEGLKRAKLRDQFDIMSKFAIRYQDLRRALLEFEPHIVHFTGHGTKKGLMVENELGLAVPISSKALSGLFELCTGHIECVILNACYSEPQAEAINRHIKHVFGMKRKIRERASTEFAVGIFDALGAGKSYEEAFKFGCNAILNINRDLQEHLIPVMKKRKNHMIQPTPDECSTSPKKRPWIFRRSRDFIPVFLVILSLILYFIIFQKNNSSSEKNNNASIANEEFKIEEDRLEKEIETLGQLLIHNLEQNIPRSNDISDGDRYNYNTYNTEKKVLTLLFLFNRGPDIYMGDFSDPLRRYLYRKIVKSANKAILARPELRTRVLVSAFRPGSLENLGRKKWLKENDRFKVGLDGTENAIYEILCSVNRVTSKITIGGRLLIGTGMASTSEKVAYIMGDDISATHLITTKCKPSRDRLIELETLTKKVQKSGRIVPVIIKSGSKNETKSGSDFITLSNGDTINKNHTIHFQFKMPKNNRYLIVLVKDGQCNIGNLIPGTANAITNGDYLISSEPGTHLTDILRDKIIFNNSTDQVRTGPFCPKGTGEYTFFFFFLEKRNMEIEEIAKQADYPGGKDIGLRSRNGILIRHPPPFYSRNDLQHIYCRKVVLKVQEH
jgi:hypothetical protein